VALPVSETPSWPLSPLKPSARPAPEQCSHVGTLRPAEARTAFTRGNARAGRSPRGVPRETGRRPEARRKFTRETGRRAEDRKEFPRGNAPVGEGAQVHAPIRAAVSLPMSVCHSVRPCRRYSCSCSESTGSALQFRPHPPQWRVRRGISRLIPGPHCSGRSHRLALRTLRSRRPIGPRNTHWRRP
jgi:hypothetical protein